MTTTQRSPQVLRSSLFLGCRGGLWWAERGQRKRQRDNERTNERLLAARSTVTVTTVLLRMAGTPHQPNERTNERTNERRRHTRTNTPLWHRRIFLCSLGSLSSFVRVVCVYETNLRAPFFARLFVCSFVRSFGGSRIRSFVRSFVCVLCVLCCARFARVNVHSPREGRHNQGVPLGTTHNTTTHNETTASLVEDRDLTSSCSCVRSRDVTCVRRCWCIWSLDLVSWFCVGVCVFHDCGAPSTRALCFV